VVNKLKLRKAADEQSLNQFCWLLWQFTISMLGDNINKVDTQHYSFTLRQSPADAARCFDTGPYRMGRDISDAYTYRIGHPLAQHLLAKAKRKDTSTVAAVAFDYSASPEKLYAVECEQGHHGLLTACVVHYHSPKEDEDCIVTAAIDSEGRVLSDDFANKLMTLSARILPMPLPTALDTSALNAVVSEKRKAQDREIAERDKQFIDEENAKIEQWADDQTFSLEQELRDIKRQIKEKDREFRKESDERLRRQLQTDIVALQRSQRQKRQNIFSLEDEIIARRDALIASIDASLSKSATQETLFTIAWTVV